MKTIKFASMIWMLVLLAPMLWAQEKICIDGKCQLAQSSPIGSIILDPLTEEFSIVSNQTRSRVAVPTQDRFDQVIRATVRVTVNNVCGSGTVDYTDEGPRVVGLLTWAGGGEGFGQSTPFLLSAMRGKLPTTLEGLPSGTREVCYQIDQPHEIVQVPSTTYGEPMQVPLGFLAQTQVQDDVLDSIIDRPRVRPSPRDSEDSGIIADRITDRIKERYMWSTSTVVATSAGSHVMSLMRDGYLYDNRGRAATLWLYYPELYPVSSPYIRDAQLRFENGDDIDQIKMDSLQKHSHILLGGRDWEWGDEIA
jgi:hypothetical protein